MDGNSELRPQDLVHIPNGIQSNHFTLQQQQQQYSENPSMNTVGFVTEQMEYDHAYPDLSILIEGNDAKGYTIGENEPSLIQKKNIPIPKALSEQYNQVEGKCLMGIFPEINRAWLTRDEKLFLWNYSNGAEFSVFDQLDNIIISVALVAPKPGIFIDEIRYLLVIATPSEIVLLGVALDLEGKGDVKLIPTQLSSPSDNVNILNIIGTPNGRIFLAGKDGNLYELLYQSGDSWFSRKCRKVNLTYNLLSSFLSNFLFNAEDPIFYLTFDHSRGLLYSLSEKNNIQVFYLGVDGKSFTYVTRLSNVYEEAKKRNSLATQKNFQMVSLHPIRAYESETILFVAVTSIGERLFFSCGKFYSIPPKSIELISIKKSPAIQNDLKNPYSRTSLNVSNVHTAFYSHLTLIIANSINEDVDGIIAVQPNSPEILSSNTLSEISSTINIEGKSWAITEIQQIDSPLLYFAQALNPKYLQNEFTSQLFLQPREYYCLTNIGLYTIAQLRPIDSLRQLISESGGQITPSLKLFIQKYPLDEVCAMCISIALNAEKTSNNPNETRMSQWAIRICLHLNEEFGIRNLDQENNFSAMFAGFCIFFSRMLSTMWYRTVVVSGDEDRSSLSFVPKELLQYCSENLISLRDLMNKVPLLSSARQSFSPNVSEESNRGGEQNKNWQELKVLLSQSIEVVNLFLLVYEVGFETIFSSLERDNQKQLCSVTFEQFLTNPSTIEVARAVASSLILYDIENNLPIDIILEQVHTKCPSLLTTNEMDYFKGIECVHQSSKAQNKKELLDQSLEYFTNSLSFFNITKLQSVCRDYVKLGYPFGAIDLAFKCAKGRNFDGKRKCYETIFPILRYQADKGLNHEILKYILSSRDELLHMELYDWIVNHGHGAILLKIRSPFIEKFLKGKKLPPEKDLLCDFYLANSNVVEAAERLKFLAESPDPQINLRMRFDFLCKAVELMSDFQGQIVDKELFTDLEEKREVAQIQVEIYNAIEVLNIEEESKKESLASLDQQLYDNTDLYNHFARVFELHEICLLIYHCSSYDDIPLIEDTWRRLFSQEQPPLSNLANKVLELGKKLYPSKYVFPLKTLISELEGLSLDHVLKTNDYTFEINWVYRIFLQIGVPFEEIHAIYLQLIESKNTFWDTNPDAKFHLLRVAFLLIHQSLKEYKTFSIIQADEAVTKYIVILENQRIEQNSSLLRQYRELQQWIRRDF